MGVGARALVLVALAVAPAAAAPLTVELAPGVTLDWQRGAVIATAVGPADRNAPSPTVARVGAARAAEVTARRRLAAALATVPVAGAALDPAAPALAREVLLAPVIAIARGTDGSARVTVALGLEAVRQATAGPRAVSGDDGDAQVVVIDARALPPTLVVGLALVHGADRWAGPVRYAATVPAGATPVVASAAAAGALTVPTLPAASAAVVVVVPPAP